LFGSNYFLAHLLNLAALPYKSGAIAQVAGVDLAYRMSPAPYCSNFAIPEAFCQRKRSKTKPTLDTEELQKKGCCERSLLAYNNDILILLNLLDEGMRKALKSRDHPNALWDPITKNDALSA